MNNYSRTLTSLALYLLLPSSLNAEAYSWKSKDGERSFFAEFVSRDELNVTVKKSDGKTFTLPIEDLHTSTQDYLTQTHPYGAEKPEVIGDAFGPLSFGDTREEVEEKLLHSSLVTTKTEKTLFGRTGLNGIFETAVPLGSLPCFLYFDWSDSGTLSEITIRTEGMGSADYEGKLRATWNETVETLKKLYGKTPLR